MELAQVQELSSEVLDEVEKAVVGKREALELVWLGFLADGHVLLEDYPGLAKTLAARSFAQVLSMRFTRIQFTPDLMPSDVTGSSIWNQRDGDFEFRPGPIFTNLLLSDEINRAPPKTQAALLEAMQERQVTIEGVTHVLEPPFLVIATQNPIEYEGTYPLPEAQLDRFLLRTAFGYPSREGEVDVLARRIERESDDVELRPVVDRETLLVHAARHRARARRDERAGVLRRPRRGDADVAEHRSGREPAREPRAPEARTLPGRARRAATTSLPDDVKAIAVPRSRTASSSARSSGCSASRPRTSFARCSRPFRRRGRRTSRPRHARDENRKPAPASGTRRSLPSAWWPRSRSAGRSSRSSPRRSRCSSRSARARRASRASPSSSSLRTSARSRAPRSEPS